MGVLSRRSFLHAYGYDKKDKEYKKSVKKAAKKKKGSARYTIKNGKAYKIASSRHKKKKKAWWK